MKRKISDQTVDILSLGESVFLRAVQVNNSIETIGGVNTAVQNLFGKKITPGAAATTIYRLIEKGYLSQEWKERAPQEGGKNNHKMKLTITPNGRKALANTKRFMDRVWEGFTP